ncbi:MAG: response regulator [Acidobacteriota bacterium]|nr:response regulator [Acidobacteriota bacterium]
MTYNPAQQSTNASVFVPSEFRDEAERRVLVVDDEEGVRNLYASFLSECGFECATASSAEEALAMLAAGAYALVISDVMMPGRNGIELLREIVARYPDTVVVMCSGVDRTQRVLDAVRLGAYDYLIKPCDLDVLSLTVEHALERRALLRAARQYRADIERSNEELRRSKQELEHLQAQIIQSEKMASLGQLAAGVAHELNNPAGFIYGNMEILDECIRGLTCLLTFYESVPLAPDVAARARRIMDEVDYEHALADLRTIVTDCREGAERICDVVQNLRTFSRLDEAEFKKVDIHEGLESTLRLLSRHYGADRIRLVRDYGELPAVDCFAGQLNQVWLNLLVNAAQATREGGEVCIRTRRDGPMAVVQIKDDGHGIAPENLKRIFDPFFTTKPVGEGTGLGLSVTYSIVERHGGNITVESTPGHGTTFNVSIPIDAPRDAEERCEA